MIEHLATDPLVDRLRTLLGAPPLAQEASWPSAAELDEAGESGDMGDTGDEHAAGDVVTDTGEPQAERLERTPLQQLVERLARGGLALQSFEAPVDVAVRAVRAGHPVSTVGNDGAVLVLLDRLGSRVRVESEGGEREWLDARRLSTRLGLSSVASEHTWLAVDAAHALPRDTHAEGSPFRLAYELVRADRADLLAIVVYATGVGLLSLVLPLTVQVLVNTVAFGTLLQPIVVLSLLLAAGLVFSAVLQAMQAFVVEMIQRRLFVRVVSQLSLRLPRADAAALEARGGPELLNRFFDVFMAQKAIASLALGGIEAALAAAVGLLLLAVYHPILLGFGILIVAGVAVVLRVVGRGATYTAIHESKAKYAVAAWLEDMAAQRITLKLAGGARFAQRRLDGLAAAWLGARDAHFRIVFRQYLGVLGLQVLVSACLLAIGGWLVVQRELTIGQLVAAELVVNAVVGSLSKLGGKLETAYDLVAAADKLHKLLDLPLERAGGVLPSTKAGAAKLELRGVSTAGGELRDASVVMEPGQRLLVRGDAQRTRALVELTFGLRAQASGAILLDGDDLRDLSLRGLRTRVMVVAGAEVLQASVSQNVAAVGSALSPRGVWRALERVGLADRVRALPEGLETTLSASGAPLTRDEVQRLVIARALAARPGLLVLDGALDGLPPDAQHALLGAIDREVTLMLVTHTHELDGAVDARLELPPEGM